MNHQQESDSLPGMDGYLFEEYLGYFAFTSPSLLPFFPSPLFLPTPLYYLLSFHPHLINSYSPLTSCQSSRAMSSSKRAWDGSLISRTPPDEVLKLVAALKNVAKSAVEYGYLDESVSIVQAFATRIEQSYLNESFQDISIEEVENRDTLP